MLANVSVTPVCHVNVTKVYLFTTSWPSIAKQSYNHASNQREDPKTWPNNETSTGAWVFIPGHCEKKKNLR